MLLAVKSRICFVAAIVLLLSRLATGQEPVDSMAITTPTRLNDKVGQAVADSIAPVTDEPDTIAFKRISVDTTGSDIILLSDTTALAQAYPLDSLDTYAKHSPAKAAIMSAVMPGLGQIYNRKYWKVPIVYAAVGVSVGIFVKWQNQYGKYRRAYIDIKDGDPNTNYFDTLGFPSSYSLDQKTQYITRRKEQLRTWRDWSIVAMIAAYALNIIDANVDAHLMDFSLDDDLSLNIQPCFLKNGVNSQKIGLTLQFTF